MRQAFIDAVREVRGQLGREADAKVVHKRIELVEDAWIMLVHGDGYHTIYQMVDQARENRCSAVLFGHTHVPLLQANGELLIVNPGSISLPRRGSKPSCALLEVDGKDINVKMLPLT